MDIKAEIIEYIEQCQTKPFQWGTFDCCMFVCDFYKQAIGIDLAHWYRDKYNDEAGAYQAMLKRTRRKKISNSLVQRVAEIECEANNFTEINYKFSQSGDMCVVNTPQGWALGLIHNGKVWATTTKGLVTLPLKEVIKAWRMPKGV